MIIKNICKITKKNEICIKCDIENFKTDLTNNMDFHNKRTFPKTLFYMFTKEFDKYISIDNYDGFVIGLLPIALITNQNITVYGNVSEELYNNIPSIIKIIYKFLKRYCNKNINNDYLPSKNVKIIICSDIIADNSADNRTDNSADSSADNRTDNSADSSANNRTGNITEKYVGTCASCGIDSNYTINKLLIRDKDINILTYVQSGHNINMDSYYTRLDNIKKFVCGILSNHNLLQIYSNLIKFNYIDNSYVHILRNLSGIYFCQNLFYTYYYSNTYTKVDQKRLIHGSFDISLVESILVPLLSTNKTKFIVYGEHITRPLKIKHLSYVNYNLHLDICLIARWNKTNNKFNCGRCGKCILFLVTADSLNVIDHYTKYIDMDFFDSNKVLCYSIIISFSINKPLSFEAIQVVKEYNYEFYSDVLYLMFKNGFKYYGEEYDKLAEDTPVVKKSVACKLLCNTEYEKYIF